MNKVISIRAFRAVDEPHTCELFYEGHVNVLRSYGVEPISSAKKEWFNNPQVYVVIAQMDDQIVGGAKLHKVGGTQPLPLEEAVGAMDKRVYDLVKRYAPHTGEGCGLWNSKLVAGMGISYILSRTVIAMTVMLGVSRMFAFSSDHTLGMFREFGFHIVRKVGKNGDFEYPSAQYISRILLINTQTLSRALPYNREVMLSLRKNPQQRRKERGPKGELEIEYNLLFS
ncbi:MAG: hypothetical protein KatS3mg031_0135 [Chitinophagales bacterium]|nr:MAG: hypothetical protein KatS3mg031_0135 [Chitinophagales bacterium]